MVLLAWGLILKKGSPEFEKLYAKHGELLDYMDKKTGWNNSLESASEFAENLIQMVVHFSHKNLTRKFLARLL
jgi:hypothetical protein